MDFINEMYKEICKKEKEEFKKTRKEKNVDKAIDKILNDEDTRCALVITNIGMVAGGSKAGLIACIQTMAEKLIRDNGFTKEELIKAINEVSGEKKDTKSLIKEMLEKMLKDMEG